LRPLDPHARAPLEFTQVEISLLARKERREKANDRHIAMPPRARKPTAKAAATAEQDDLYEVFLHETKKKAPPKARKEAPAPAPAPAPKKKPAAAAVGKRKAPPADDLYDDEDEYYDEDEEELEEEDEPEEFEEEEDDDEDDYRGAKKKKKSSSKKKAPASSRSSPSPAKKQKKAVAVRAEPGVEPTSRAFEPATGWWIDPTLPLIWTTVGADGQVGAKVEARGKIAAFDLDGTLCQIKGSGPAARGGIPRHEHDWVLFSPKVKIVVKNYFKDGYEIVVISNQGQVQTKLAGKMAQLVKARSAAIAQELGVPLTMIMCPARGENPYRKPEVGMWDFFERELRGPGAPPIDRTKSVYVGDAAGRPGDHLGSGSDHDLAFATRLGLPFQTPEEAFGASTSKVREEIEDREEREKREKREKTEREREERRDSFVAVFFFCVSSRLVARRRRPCRPLSTHPLPLSTKNQNKTQNRRPSRRTSTARASPPPRPRSRATTTRRGPTPRSSPRSWACPQRSSPW
jgi:DNA 3'-phosphatase